jgi:hypothetical protein
MGVCQEVAFEMASPARYKYAEREVILRVVRNPRSGFDGCLPGGRVRNGFACSLQLCGEGSDFPGVSKSAKRFRWLRSITMDTKKARSIRAGFFNTGLRLFENDQLNAAILCGFRFCQAGGRFQAAFG